ncbi:MAG: alpha/beta fold hydrolase [Haloarculaceae archaeon]
MGRPDLLEKLVVMNAPHPAAFAREFDREQLRRSWYMLAFQLPWLPERLLTADGCRAIGELFREQPTNPDACSEADVARYREAFCQPGAARAAIDYYRAFGRAMAWPLVRERLPFVGWGGDLPGDTEIPVPTLVCWGEQDAALSLDLVTSLDEWVPELRVERYPEASHWVQLDVPNKVNAALSEFLGAK